MYHSYKALKEFQGVDAKQRKLILMVSGMRQWKEKKAWQNYVFNVLFMIVIPAIALYYADELFDSEAVFFLCLFGLYFLGYKVAFHFQVARLLPYIRQCIDGGITEEELAKINDVKKLSVKKRLIAGCMLGVFFAVLTNYTLTFALGHSLSWSMILPISLCVGLLISFVMFHILKRMAKEATAK